MKPIFHDFEHEFKQRDLVGGVPAYDRGIGT